MKESTISRCHAASAVLTGVAGLALSGFASWSTERHYSLRPDWPTMLFGLAVAGAGVSSYARRTLSSAVFARGAALSVLVPRVFNTAIAILIGHELPPLPGLVVGGLAAAAFVTSGPAMSEGPIARDFSPIAYRRLLLWGATAATATAFTTALLATAGAFHFLPWRSAAFAAATAMEVAAVLGVLRMRAWGVLLGIAVSLGLVAYFTAMPYYTNPRIVAYAAGALFVAPLFLAQWPMRRRGQVRRLETPTRIAVDTVEARSSNLDDADEDLEVRDRAMSV